MALVSMAVAEQHFMNLYNNGAIYVWGMNCIEITQASIDAAYVAHGNDKYNRNYYDNKLIEGLGKIGADCSGACYPLSVIAGQDDLTAQEYYDASDKKGSISKVPFGKKCVLVFRGSSTRGIVHVGLLTRSGYTIEMRGSKENCEKHIYDQSKWNYYAYAPFIDYSQAANQDEQYDLDDPDYDYVYVAPAPVPTPDPSRLVGRCTNVECGTTNDFDAYMLGLLLMGTRSIMDGSDKSNKSIDVSVNNNVLSIGIH